jgi:hypothetical protein
MATTRRFIALAALAFFLGPISLAQERRISLEPIAVSGIGPKQVAVLNENGDVIVVGPTGEKRLVHHFSNGQVSDFAGLPVQGGYALLISGWRAGGPTTAIGALNWMPGDHTLTSLGRLYSGVALFPAAESGEPVGYVSDGTSREIQRITLSQGRLVAKFVATIPDTLALPGAIAVDPSGTLLYVIDMIGGRIWQSPTTGGTPVVFATDLREPRAIAVDKDSVFVADAETKSVYALPRGPITGAAQQPRTPARARVIAPPEFERPVGLSIAEAGHIWVGDASARSVFLITLSDGQVKQAIR